LEVAGTIREVAKPKLKYEAVKQAKVKAMPFQKVAKSRGMCEDETEEHQVDADQCHLELNAVNVATESYHKKDGVYKRCDDG
jgi:hypothetical protein